MCTLLLVGGKLSFSFSSEAVESELGASFSSLPLLSQLLFVLSSIIEFDFLECDAQGEDGAGVDSSLSSIFSISLFFTVRFGREDLWQDAMC